MQLSINSYLHVISISNTVLVLMSDMVIFLALRIASVKVEESTLYESDTNSSHDGRFWKEYQIKWLQRVMKAHIRLLICNLCLQLWHHYQLPHLFPHLSMHTNTFQVLFSSKTSPSCKLWFLICVRWANLLAHWKWKVHWMRDWLCSSELLWQILSTFVAKAQS